MIILDTNIVSALMAPGMNPLIDRWFALQAGNQLRLTVVTQAEIGFGIAKLPAGKRRDQLRAAVDRIFASVAGRPLPFDSDAADLYGHIVAERHRMGRPIGVLDAEIAAIALVNGATIATRNESGFADTGVGIVNPYSSGRNTGRSGV